MDGSIESVTSGISAITQQYQVITNNLANASTAGFKRQISALLQVAPEGPGLVQQTNITENPSVDFSQGSLTATGRALDLALQGKGFFVIETPEGPVYTRHGVFQVNARGQLVDMAGRTVSGQGGPIILPPTVSPSRIQVGQDGQVSAGGELLGTLQIMEFEDPQRLTAAGLASFRAPAGVSPDRARQTTVHQGFQEASNVSVVQELVNLIWATRLYEANIKTMQTQDDRMEALLRVAMA